MDTPRHKSILLQTTVSTVYNLRHGSAALVLIVLAVAFSVGQERRANNLPFASGEELLYQAEFSRGLLRGANVGELRFDVNGPIALNRSEQILVGDAIGKGLLLKLFGEQFHLHVESTVTTEPFTVRHTSKLDEERKRVRVSEATFDHETHQAVWSDRDPRQSEPPVSKTLAFTEPVQDILTVIYFLRTRRLEPGQWFDVPVVDAGRLYRFSVSVRERKQIRTVLGRVWAVRVEPSIVGEDTPARNRGTLSLWLTDDARRIPVKAQITVPAGRFDISLKRVTNRAAQPSR